MTLIASILLASAVELEMGGGIGFAIDDGVQAPVISARGGVVLGGFDLSGRFVGALGPESQVNFDGGTAGGYHALAGLLELGLRPRVAPIGLRFHTGTGPAVATFLPNRYNVVSGQSRGAPVFALGFEVSTATKIAVCLDVSWMLFTGLHTPGGPSYLEPHGSTANTFVALLSLRFSPGP